MVCSATAWSILLISDHQKPTKICHAIVKIVIRMFAGQSELNDVITCFVLTSVQIATYSAVLIKHCSYLCRYSLFAVAATSLGQFCVCTGLAAK